MKKVILREAIVISLMRLIEYSSSFHRRLSDADIRHPYVKGFIGTISLNCPNAPKRDAVVIST